MARFKKSPAALAVAVGIMLSRVAGLIRDRVFAYYLGNSEAAGAFRAALRIPNLLQNLFGEGVLSASFIPVYARLRAEERHEDAVRAAGAVGTLLALIVTILAAAGTLGARPLIGLLAPGFEGEVRELTVEIVQIMFPGVALLVLSAWCLGVLNSHRKFLLSYVAPVLWNLAIIAALLAFGPGRSSTSAGQFELARLVAWGTVIGAGLQLFVQLPTAMRLTRGLRPTFARGDQEVRTIMRNFLPVVVSRGVVQISAYVDQMIASYLGAAIVAAMAYAQTLYLLPISLFGMSISAAELPAMSSVTGTDEAIREKLRSKLVTSLRRVTFFVIPSVVAFAILGDVVVATIFQTGEFARNDVLQVWIILAGSTVGLLATTQGRLCSTAFYALRDTRKPLRFACIRVAITGVAGYLLALPMRRALGLSEIWGAGALTMTAGFAGWVEFLLLRRALSQRIGAFRVGARYLASLWSLAIGAGAVGFGLKCVLPDLYPVVTGVLVLGVYGAIYLGGSILLGLGEAAAVRKKLDSWRGRAA